MRNNKRMRLAAIDAQIECLRQQYADAEGRWNIEQGSALHEALAEWLRDNPEQEDESQLALYHLRRHDHARRPRREKGQPLLFDPEAILSLSETGDRILMRDARLRHALEARAVRDQAHFAENEDYRADASYWNSRIAAYQNTTETLEEVEMRAFGWMPEDEADAA